MILDLIVYVIEDSNYSLDIHFLMESALWLNTIQTGIKFSNLTTLQTVILPEYRWLLKVCRFSMKKKRVIAKISIKQEFLLNLNKLIEGNDQQNIQEPPQAIGSSPQSLIVTFFLGRSPLSVSWDSINLTMSMPSKTWPNTTCLWSNHGVCQFVKSIDYIKTREHRQFKLNLRDK